MPELRKDPVSGGWIIVTTERGKLPSEFGTVTDQRKGGPCPFCEGHEEETPPEIAAYRDDGQPNGPGWSVRTVPNKSAVLKVEGELDRRGDGLYDVMNGIGAHEIVIESPDHDADLSTLPLEQLSLAIRMHRDRSLDLRKDKRLRYLQVFRNHGEAAGATMEHPHSQIIALPITPRWLKEELVSAKAHFEFKERCLFCDIMWQELSDHVRIVYENRAFVCFVPFASKSPFEVWALPKRHDSDFGTIENEEIEQMARALKSVTGALSRGLHDPPYNFIIHSAPFRDERPGYWKTIDKDFHWHIEIIPRLTQMAGFEWGTGFYLNPTPPEQSAQYLREEME